MFMLNTFHNSLRFLYQISLNYKYGDPLKTESYFSHGYHESNGFSALKRGKNGKLCGQMQYITIST